MTDITINDSSLDVASRLTAAKRNTDEPVEPSFLPRLVPGAHLYLGSLPRELCHVYLEVVKLTEEYNPRADDPAATQRALTRIELARKMFCASLRKYFRQYAEEDSTEEFVICASWKVGLCSGTSDENQLKDRFPAGSNPP